MASNFLHDGGFTFEYTGGSFKKLLIWKYYLLRRYLAFERYQKSTRTSGALSKIKSLKGYFSGPALIVGNGPSSLDLRDYDLKEMSATSTIFCQNFFFESELANYLTPDYLFICDELFWREDTHGYRQRVEIEQAKLNFSLVQPDYLPTFGSEYSNLKIRKNPLTSFTRRISVTSYFCGMPNYTAFYMIATAIYLGYSPIYIIGNDFNHYKFVNFYDGELQLDPHHSYAETSRPWRGRNKLIRVLNANLQQIDSLRLFCDYPVYFTGNFQAHDTLPFIDLPTLLAERFRK